MNVKRTHPDPSTVISLSMPASPLEPTLGYLRYHGLRFACLPREALSSLDRSWLGGGAIDR